jgi:Protein of unknown function (DUF4089)
MTSEIDPTGYVRRAEEMIGLQISPDDETAVVAIFANLARAAASLAAFPLAEAVEPAAIFIAFDENG